MTNSDQLTIGSKPAPGDLLYVQGFVNTRYVGDHSDDLATTDRAAAWFQRFGLLPPGSAISEAERGQAVGFREGLRYLLKVNHGAPVEVDEVASLRRIIDSLPMRLSYNDDGSLELRASGEGMAGALGALQAVVYRATSDGTWFRLKACPGQDCQWAFYDASKNHSGVWCTMEVCGNREKVRSHRARKAHTAH